MATAQGRKKSPRPTAAKPRSRAGALPTSEAAFRPWAISQLRRMEKATRPGDELEAQERKTFLQHWFGTLMLEGPSVGHRVSVIRRLVEMQMPASRTARYELCFHGAVYKTTPSLRVEKLGDIDFADLHGITELDTLEVYRLDASPWGRGEAEAVLQHIRADMDADGAGTNLHADVYTDGDGNNEVLVVRGDWEADDDDAGS